MDSSSVDECNFRNNKKVFPECWNRNFDIVSVGLSIDSDPFEDLDDDNGLNSQLNELVGQACHDDPPDLNMYINFDQDFPICHEFDDDTWNDEFFSELDKSQEAVRSTRPRLEDQDSKDDEDEAPSLPKIKSLPEAIYSLEQVKYHLEFYGYGSEADSISIAIHTIAEVQMKKFMSAKQTCIHEYFN